MLRNSWETHNRLPFSFFVDLHFLSICFFRGSIFYITDCLLGHFDFHLFVFVFIGWVRGSENLRGVAEEEIMRSNI